MDEFIKWFESHPEISIGGLIIGLVLTVVSIYQAVRYRKVKRFAYSILTYNLIKDYSEKVNGLDVKFKGEKIKNLSITKVAIWNNGNETIDSNDNVKNDILRLEFKDGVRVLDFSIIQQNEVSNQFELFAIAEKNSVGLKFEYFDERHGCVIQVIHDGQNSSDISVKGKLKGIDRLEGVAHSKVLLRFGDIFRFTKKKQLNRQLSGFVFIAACLALYLMNYYGLFQDSEPKNKWVIWIALIPYLIIGFTLLFKRIPKGLESFDERL